MNIEALAQEAGKLESGFGRVTRTGGTGRADIDTRSKARVSQEGTASGRRELEQLVKSPLVSRTCWRSSWTAPSPEKLLSLRLSTSIASWATAEAMALAEIRLPVLPLWCSVQTNILWLLHAQSFRRSGKLAVSLSRPDRTASVNVSCVEGSKASCPATRSALAIVPLPTNEKM